MLEYICVQSALLFVIINIYSVYSIYFGVGHFNFTQEYIYIYIYIYIYLLLGDKGWCLQAIRTAGHTLDFTSKPLLVSKSFAKNVCTDLFWCWDQAKIT